MSAFEDFKKHYGEENCGTGDYTRFAFEYAYNLAKKETSPARQYPDSVPIDLERIANLTAKVVSMKAVGDQMLIHYAESVEARQAAEALSRQNHEAALGFQERALHAEEERDARVKQLRSKDERITELEQAELRLQHELTAALGPCKLCQVKSDQIRDALRPAGNDLYLMDPVGAITIAVQGLLRYQQIVASIRGEGTHIFRIDESQRQATLLALGHLAAERPGWDFMLSEIALRMDNTTADGRPELFDRFKKMHAEDMAIRKPRE